MLTSMPEAGDDGQLVEGHMRAPGRHALLTTTHSRSYGVSAERSIGWPEGGNNGS